MAKRVLFIGGPADGKWIATRGLPRTYDIPIMPKFDFSDDIPDGPKFSYSRATYRRDSFCIQGSGEIVVYILKSMSLWDAIVRIFQNYRPDRIDQENTDEVHH